MLKILKVKKNQYENMENVSVSIKIVTNGQVGETWQQKKKAFDIMILTLTDFRFSSLTKCGRILYLNMIINNINYSY